MSQAQQKLIQEIDQFPKKLHLLIKNRGTLKNQKGSKEWSLAQIVHHLADAHMNKFFQIRQTLTENNPDLVEYRDKLFPNLPDGKSPNIENSLAIIDGIHSRTAILLKNLKTTDWHRRALHPQMKTITIENIVQSFVAHQEAHLKQIRLL